MKQYKDLTENEKVLFNRMEDLFKYHPSITKVSFVKVLGILINKYKIKSVVKS